MRDPLNRTTQKRVAADTIAEGDMIFRRAPAGGAVMMIIESATTGTHDGMDVFVWTGVVFSLRGDGAGPNPNFLGDMTAHPIGRGEWKCPVDANVDKGVPPDQGDYQYHVAEPDRPT